MSLVTPDSVKCPRCAGTGSAVWVQPGGNEVPIRCGLCRGSRVVSRSAVAAETRTRKTPAPAPERSATR